MKKLFFYISLVSIFTLNSGAGCSNEKDEPKSDNFTSLVGKWKLESYVLTKYLTDGRQKDSFWRASDHKVSVFWEFKSNGAFISSMDETEAQGRWELKVSKAGDGVIEDGILSFSGAGTEETAETITGKEKLSGRIFSSKDNMGPYFTIIYEADISVIYFPDAKRVTYAYTYRKV